MHLAGPREVCVCITYSREAWIEGPAGGGAGGDAVRHRWGAGGGGGGVGEIAREMRVV